MAKISMAERIQKLQNDYYGGRSSTTKAPLSSETNPLTQTSPHPSPAAKRARRAPSTVATTTSTTPSIEQVSTGQSNDLVGPSVFHTGSQIVASSICSQFVRDVDFDVVKNASAKELEQISSQLTVQMATLTKAWTEKTQKYLAEIQDAKVEAQDAKVEAQNAKAEVKRLTKLIQDNAAREVEANQLAEKTQLLETKLAEAVEVLKVSYSNRKEAGVREYMASVAHAFDLAKAVSDFKQSDDAEQWVENRAVEYMNLAFTRCRLQFEASGILPEGADLNFLDLTKSMPGEPEVPSFGSIEGESTPTDPECPENADSIAPGPEATVNLDT